MGLDLACKTLASSLSEGIRDSEKTHGVADASCKKMASNSENTPFKIYLWACKDTACLGSRDGRQHAQAGGVWEGSGTQLQHKGSLPVTLLSTGVTIPFRSQCLCYGVHRCSGCKASQSSSLPAGEPQGCPAPVPREGLASRATEQPEKVQLESAFVRRSSS